MDAESSSTAAAAAAGTPAAPPSSVSLFKKKGGTKRKEFRAPAASLQGREGNKESQQQEHNTQHKEQTTLVEDVTHDDEDAAPSSVAAASAAASTSAPPPVPVRPSSMHELDESDSDDEHAASSSSHAIAAARAQASDVDTSDPEGDDVDDGPSAAAGGAPHPTKRARRTNPLAQSTRDALQQKKTLDLTISSNRSLLPDVRAADKQVTGDKLHEADTAPGAASFTRDPKKPKWSGPMKPQANNVRMISRFDYQPDICKDYKETGRCGYGDSCVFMHDRGDYKGGWQLENDWNKAQEERRKRVLAGGSADAEDTNYEIAQEEDMPWACLICREEFKNPVVTKCKHYFCENCALQHYAKDTKCFACRVQTQGIFNTATELINTIKKRAATGSDPRAALEEAEQARKADQAKRSSVQGWGIK